MSTHSSPPLSVGQNVLSPNKPIRTASMYNKLLKQMITMQKQQLERSKLLERSRKLDQEETQSMFQQILSLLNITDITLENKYVSQTPKQNEEQHDLTTNYIKLHDTNTLHKASVVKTPTAISEPANTSDKYVSIPISLIISIPSSEDQPLMPEAPQPVADMPVAATATKVDTREAPQAHCEPESTAKAQPVTPSPTQSPVTLYNGCMAELTYCKVPTSPRPPLLVHLAVTVHRFLHYTVHAQLVNLIPFDPGGM